MQTIREKGLAGTRLAFTNTNPSHHAQWSREHADILTLFKHVFVSSEIAMRKPDVAAYLFVCSEIAQPPQNVLFFDDREDNIAGAKSAGMQTLLVRDSQDVATALAALDLL